MEVMATYEADAQRKAELHLEECYELAEDDDSAFCGCTTCIVREVLTAAAPDLYRALVELLEENRVFVPPEVAALYEDFA